MNIIIDRPSNIATNILAQLVALVKLGDQVETIGFEQRLKKADIIALLIEKDTVVSTATLKNPSINYRNNVFRAAKAPKSAYAYSKELGYVVTHPLHEGNKYCQKLLTRFLPLIENQNMFATTRKPSMIHILSKVGFQKLGSVYKTDLNLLIFHGKK